MTIAELQARFPEFLTEDSDRLQLAIDDSEIMVGSCFGKFRTLAVAYMAAHLFTMNKQTESGNTAPLKEIASQAVGSVNVSYVSSSDARSNHSSTSYGKQYDDLKKKCCIGGVSIG